MLGEAYLEEFVERAVVQTAVRELLMDPVGLGDGAAERVSRCVDLTIPMGGILTRNLNGTGGDGYAPRATHGLVGGGEITVEPVLGQHGDVQ